MGAIKITAADRAFSLCVRERADNRCERCGGVPAKGGLHCSHFHGRGKHAVRYDPENATALCMGCHLHLTSHPAEHLAWVCSKLGPWRFDALRERANDATRGRGAKREQKSIAAHYRRQFNIICQKRAEGAEGRIDFEGYL